MKRSRRDHKCPQIAERQIKAGAIGLCIATIRKAEAISAAGIKNLLITTELVGKPKSVQACSVKLAARAGVLPFNVPCFRHRL